MAIKVISKIQPKNDAFEGLIDGKQVIGGAGNEVPDDAISESSVTQHVPKAEELSTDETDGTKVMKPDGVGGTTWGAASSPGAHATTHQNGGADEISVTDLSGLLADAQTPLSHAASHADGAADEISVEVLATAGATGTVPVAQADGSLLMAAPAPATHATAHQNGGADEISVTDLSGLLADAQTPLSHAASHADGAADEISVTDLSGLLADAQTPLSHAASHADGAADEISVEALATAGATGTVPVAQADGSLLMAAPAPATHATAHQNGGADEISHTAIADIGTYTHATIDTHINSAANPHTVTKAQVSLGNVTDDAQLKRAAADFSSFTLKGSPHADDVILVEDSEAANVKKYITVGSIAGATEFSDDEFRIQDGADDSKEIAFQASGITTSTIRTITMPDKDGTLFDAQDLQGVEINSAAPSDYDYLKYDGTQWAPVKDVVLNVQDFGADGSETAIDDTAAIQAALDQAEANALAHSGPTTVFFPQGRYRITSTLTATDMVTLQGEMGTRFGSLAGGLPQSMLFWYGGATPLLNLVTTSLYGCKVKGLAFDGRNIATTLINMEGQRAPVIEDCGFMQCDKGIVLGTATHWATVERCRFDYCHVYGIEVSGVSNANRIVNNTFNHRSDGGWTEVSIEIVGSNATVIANTSFEGAKNGSKYIRLSGSNSRHTQITNNRFETLWDLDSAETKAVILEIVDGGQDGSPESTTFLDNAVFQQETKDATTRINFDGAIIDGGLSTNISTRYQGDSIVRNPFFLGTGSSISDWTIDNATYSSWTRTGGRNVLTIAPGGPATLLHYQIKDITEFRGRSLACSMSLEATDITSGVVVDFMYYKNGDGTIGDLGDFISGRTLWVYDVDYTVAQFDDAVVPADADHVFVNINPNKNGDPSPAANTIYIDYIGIGPLGFWGDMPATEVATHAAELAISTNTAASHTRGHTLISTSDHTDVDGTAPTENDVLKWNGSSWMNVPEGTEFSDATLRIQDDADASKQIAFQAGIITPETTRVATMPDKDGTLFDAQDLQGFAVATTTPTDEYVLTWNSTSAKWEPAEGAGGFTTPLTQTVFVDGTRVDSYTEDGTEALPYKDIQSAINAITDATVDKVYTVFIKPGKYVLTADIVLKQYVGLRGQSREGTIIDVDSYTLEVPSGVAGSEIATVENLTVMSTSDTPDSAGLISCIGGGRGLKIRSTTVSYSGYASGAFYGIKLSDANATSTIDDVDIIMTNLSSSSTGFYGIATSSTSNSLVLSNFRIEMISIDTTPLIAGIALLNFDDQISNSTYVGANIRDGAILIRSTGALSASTSYLIAGLYSPQAGGVNKRRCKMSNVSTDIYNTSPTAAGGIYSVYCDSSAGSSLRLDTTGCNFRTRYMGSGGTTIGYAAFISVDDEWYSSGDNLKDCDMVYDDNRDGSGNGIVAIEPQESLPFKAVNASTYTIKQDDGTIYTDYSSTGASDLTLSSENTWAGRRIKIKDRGGSAGTNAITISTEGVETIEGIATLVIDENYKAVILECDGTNYHVVSDALADNHAENPVTAVAASTYTIVPGNSIVNVTYTATGAVTLTLDSDCAYNGFRCQIVDAGLMAYTNNITVQTEGSELINLETTWVLNGNGDSLEIYSDGSDYFISNMLGAF